MGINRKFTNCSTKCNIFLTDSPTRDVLFMQYGPCLYIEFLHVEFLLFNQVPHIEKILIYTWFPLETNQINLESQEYILCYSSVG